MKFFTTILTVIIFASAAFHINAQSWTDMHTIPPYDLTTDGTNVYKVRYGGNGMYASTNEAGTWAKNDSVLYAQPFGTLLGYNIFITSTGRLITSRGKSSTNYKIIYSDDKGLTWTESGSTLNAYHSGIVESNSAIYMIGGNIGKYSTDNGATWTSVPYTVKYLPAGFDGDTIYMGRTDTLLAVNSKTWTIISKHKLPASGGEIKSFGQNFFHINLGDIYYSTDKDNWTKITPPGSPVVPAVEDVAMNNGAIYIATSKGVYKSTNGGSSWTNPGGTSLMFEHIVLTNNYIVAGYHYQSSGYTYRLAESGTGIREWKLLDFSMYPNPTNNYVNILLGKPQEASLYNSQGQVISNYQFTSGNNSINIAALGAGIYYVRIGGVTKRLIVDN